MNKTLHLHSSHTTGRTQRRPRADPAGAAADCAAARGGRRRPPAHRLDARQRVAIYAWWHGSPGARRGHPLHPHAAARQTGTRGHWRGRPPRHRRQPGGARRCGGCWHRGGWRRGCCPAGQLGPVSGAAHQRGQRQLPGDFGGGQRAQAVRLTVLGRLCVAHQWLRLVDVCGCGPAFMENLAMTNLAAASGPLSLRHISGVAAASAADVSAAADMCSAPSPLPSHPTGKSTPSS